MFKIKKNKLKKQLYGEINWKIDDKLKYKKFDTPEEATQWGEEHYSEWGLKYKENVGVYNKFLDSSFAETIEYYCGWSYRGINNYLRNGVDEEDNHYREMADILCLHLVSAPRIPCDIVVYRVVGDNFIDRLIECNKYDIYECIHEKGFMSTSLIESIAKMDDAYKSGKNLLKIFVPGGTVGLYVNSVCERNEQEILLAPNTFLGLLSYPYYKKSLDKKVFECILTHYHY